MAVNSTVSSSNVRTETALTSLTLTRTLAGGFGMPQTPEVPTIQWGVSIAYAESRVLVDEHGAMEAVVYQGRDQRWVNLTPERVKTFYALPISVSGQETTLGDYIAHLCDQFISEDLAKPKETLAAPVSAL